MLLRFWLHLVNLHRANQCKLVQVSLSSIWDPFWGGNWGTQPCCWGQIRLFCFCTLVSDGVVSKCEHHLEATFILNLNLKTP